MFKPRKKKNPNSVPVMAPFNLVVGDSESEGGSLVNETKRDAAKSLLRCLICEYFGPKSHYIDVYQHWWSLQSGNVKHA